MQFPGYLISSDGDKVTITRTIFDDTQLSEESDWKEAHENDDANAEHGYVVWSDALTDIERRLGLEAQDGNSNKLRGKKGFQREK